MKKSTIFIIYFFYYRKLLKRNLAVLNCLDTAKYDGRAIGMLGANAKRVYEKIQKVSFVYKNPFTRMAIYAIIYMKSELDFGKDDIFARNGFRMAFRHCCGDRHRGIYG